MLDKPLSKTNLGSVFKRKVHSFNFEFLFQIGPI